MAGLKPVRAATTAALRGLRRVLDLVPLTPLGLALALGAGVTLRLFALPALDLIWWVVGLVAVGLVVSAILLVTIAAVVLRVLTRERRAAEDDAPVRELETGAPLPTGFRIPHLGLLPLVQVRWTWLDPPGAKVTLTPHRFFHAAEEVELTARGRADAIRRRIEVQDAFGLARIALRRPERASLTVLPHVGKLGQLPLLVSMAGGDERPHPMGVDDGDRVELRRYVPGDPARFIHWKVYGRTRKLMVRVPERALTPARRAVAYLVAGEGDEATAAAARVALEADALGASWTFGADGAPRGTQRLDEALSFIVDSAAHRDAGGQGLRAFLSDADRHGPASAVLFVPPRPGAWLALAVAAARSRVGRTRFVIGVDGIAAEELAPWWRWLLWQGRRRSDTTGADLDEVVRALRATRADVVVLDRTTGRRVGKHHRAAMRALEQERSAA